MATGRVLQYDDERGYGFVAADDGGEDVFLHASTFDGDSYELRPGVRVEFQIMAGDRGRKAFAAHLAADEAPPAEPSRPSRPAGTDGPKAGPSPSLLHTLSAPAPREPTGENTSDEERMCDVLSQAEFGQELTELLLDNAPALTGQQIQQVRRSVLEFADKHGWVDI